MQAVVSNVIRSTLVLVFLLGMSGCCIIVDGMTSQAHLPTLKADNAPVQVASPATP